MLKFEANIMVVLKPRVVALDFETFYNKECSVKPLGAWAYCHHPEFYAYLMSVSDGVETWVGEPKDFDWACLEGCHILSHNAFFDRNVYEAGVEKGLYPRVKFFEWDCTANMTAALCNRRSLKDSALFLLGIEMSKDVRDQMKGKHWAEVKDTPLGVAFKTYAERDALICWQLWDKFSDRWPEFERALSRATIEQCMFGVQVDVKKLDEYIMTGGKLLFEVEKKLPWIETAGAKPTSTKAIATACRNAGIPCPPIKAHEGEEAYQEWEDTYKAKYSWVNAVVQWRSLNKFLGTLDTLKSRLRPDGTFSYGLKYFGAHTGRWSGDAGINMQNLKSVPILVDTDNNIRLDDASADEFLSAKETDAAIPWLGTTNWSRTSPDGTPHPNFSAHIYDIRSLFIARPGKKLVLCDLAQIEPRVLAWLSGHTRMLEAIRSGYGVYEAAAIATGKYSGPKGGFKKLKLLYKAQKAQTLALGYGCGWDRYIDAAYTLARYDVCKNDRTNPETGKIIYGSAARDEVTAFREDNKEIPALWNKLDKAFHDSIESDFIMELPTGRYMTYRSVSRKQKPKKRIIINEETGEVVETKIETRWVYTAEIDGRRYELYGGLLTENITQAVAREVLGYHMLTVQAASIRVLWSVHDELICEVDPDFDPKRVELLMSETPPWMPGCPLGAESKETPCYLK